MLPLSPGIVLEAIKFFRIVKSRILKNYGVTGIEVTLNIADQMVLTNLVDELDHKMSDYCTRGINEFPLPEVDTLLHFLKKLVLKDTVKPTIFEDEDEEQKKEVI